MKSKIIIGLTGLALLTTSLALPVYSQDASGFRAPSEGTWYHPLEVDEWVELGANRAVIEATLKRIEETQGERSNDDQPDTLIAYGPGNWTFEWARNGEIALAEAKSATSPALIKQAAQQAIMYFTMASSPHTHDPNNLAALKKAGEAYLLASGQIPETVKQVEIAYEGRSFVANFHIPMGEGPFPFVIASQGSDQSKEMLFSYFEEFLAPRHIGLISLDIPGMGGSAAYDIQDGRTEKLHIAALNWAKQQAEVNTDAIFVQGSSFGGHAATRTFLQADKLGIAGVISICGLVESAFLAPPEAYAELPNYATDGVKSRLKLPVGGGFDDFAKYMRPLAISTAALMDGRKRKTPLLVISTNDDPVVPLNDIDALLAHASHATRIILDEEGHCPQSEVEDILAVSWIVDQLPLESHDDDDD